MIHGHLIRAVVAGALVAACAPSNEGPGSIVWGRDVCALCQMVISDPSDAAQLRSAHDHRLHFFDDLGCALLWEAEQAHEGVRVEEFWVSDPTRTTWRDGEQARYSDGHRTPMNHGFRVSEASEGFDLEQVRQRVVEMERERRSARR